MAKFETKPNTGALFKNDKGGNAKRPDYRGNLNVDGTMYDLAAWLTTAESGKVYMSLKVQEPRQRQEPKHGADYGPEPDDSDIPF